MDKINDSCCFRLLSLGNFRKGFLKPLTSKFLNHMTSIRPCEYILIINFLKFICSTINPNLLDTQSKVNDLIWQILKFL